MVSRTLATLWLSLALTPATLSLPLALALASATLSLPLAFTSPTLSLPLPLTPASIPLLLPLTPTHPSIAAARLSAVAAWAEPQRTRGLLSVAQPRILASPPLPYTLAAPKPMRFAVTIPQQ